MTATSTIETLNELKKVQSDASALFVAFSVRENPEDCFEKLKELSKAKVNLRNKVNSCHAIYTACTFELAFSVLATRELRAISGSGIKHLVTKTLCLVGACESAYALLGNAHENPADLSSINVKRFKTRGRTDQSGDEELLKFLLKRQVLAHILTISYRY